MIVSNLSTGAEACIKIMELDAGQAETVRSCILKYTFPENFCEKLYWLAYRIIQAIKSIIGTSDWQTTSLLIESHYMQNALNQKIVQQNPENSLERKIKDRTRIFFESIIQDLLSITLLAQEEKQNITVNLNDQLNKISLKNALLELRNTRRDIESHVAASAAHS